MEKRPLGRFKQFSLPLPQQTKVTVAQALNFPLWIRFPIAFKAF